MCTHPHLSLSLYIKHIFLTLKLYCITLLAENGKIPSQLSFIVSSVHITGKCGGVSAFKTVVFKCTSFNFKFHLNEKSE